MKQKFIDAHMKVAEVYAELSSAVKLHVGAIIVKNDRIISIGYNGMPAGWDNNCELTEYVGKNEQIESPDNMRRLGFTESNNGWFRLETRPEVLHAETNAIAKLARSSESGEGASIFITHAPCLQCAKLIYQSGINSVYYRNTYRSDDGLNFLSKCNIEVEKI